jgi:hypothetical protein
MGKELTLYFRCDKTLINAGCMGGDAVKCKLEMKLELK